MDVLQNYSSDSDSGSDSEVESVKQTSQLPKPSIPSSALQSTLLASATSSSYSQNQSSNKVLGSSIKNTFNDSSEVKQSTVLKLKSSTKATDFVPTHLLRKRSSAGQQQPQQRPTKIAKPDNTSNKDNASSIEQLIEKNIALHKKDQPTQDTNEVTDLFGIGGGSSDFNLRISKTADVRDDRLSFIHNANNEKLGSSLSNVNSEKTDKDEEVIKIGKSKINNSEIIDLNMSNLYATNSSLIKSGELNHSEIITNYAKARYYQEGNNNLANIIKFTEGNREKLDRQIERNDEKMGKTKK